MSFFGIPMRNGLSLGLGTVASLTNGPGFLPDELFYGGTVQGAWYDPSDLSTLFQDSAGTTPVTAVEQAVGLMLDKSKGLVLGPELVTNGDFSQGSTGWTTTATGGNAITISSGSVRIQATGADFCTLSQSAVVSVGKWYRVEFDVLAGSSGQLKVLPIGGAPSEIVFSCVPGRKTFNSFVVSGTTFQIARVVGQVADAYIDNISVRELPGNHAFQTSSASRPTLRARYNLFTLTESFSGAPWFSGVGYNSVLTQSATISPAGTNTGVLLSSDTVGGNGLVMLARGGTLTANISYTLSFFAKANTLSWIRLFSLNFGLNGGAYYDLQNGAVGTVDSGFVASILPQANGWFRCVLTFTPTLAGPGELRFQLANSNGNTSVARNGITSVYAWGAQLTNPAVFPSDTYQRVGAATDYATGAAFPPYLFFDGTDDSMLTNSVDFTGTDKMLVVAGVTKNSDALVGIVVELSADKNTNAGSFYMAAPESTGASGNFSVCFRGSVNAAPVFSAITLAPVTRVVTGLGDITANSQTIRTNGVAVTNSPGMGVGNFGNYPLYIGRRNNATLPFNGQMYSLVIAGAAYSAGQISSTESWVAAKTPLGTI